MGDLIAKLCRVPVTDQGGRYPRRWGLSFQRPDKRAVEQNQEAVRVRREETWPAIRARAKAEGVAKMASQALVRRMSSFCQAHCRRSMPPMAEVQRVGRTHRRAVPSAARA